jgi:hypothetical protein
MRIVIVESKGSGSIATVQEEVVGYKVVGRDSLEYRGNIALVTPHGAARKYALRLEFSKGPTNFKDGCDVGWFRIDSWWSTPHGGHPWWKVVAILDSCRHL